MTETFVLVHSKGTNGAIWSLVAIFGYTRAIMLGEVMKEAKDNKAGRVRA